MLKTLVKKQMQEIFRSYFYDEKKNKKRSTASTVMYILLYVLIMVGVLGGMFTFLSVAICGAFTAAGMGWLYFALMGLLAILLGTFGSVFNTYAGLYLSKDNDLLFSLPIPVRYIMISRLISVYLMGLMYSAVVIVPADIVYWVTTPFSVGTLVGPILLTFLISVFVLVLSCLLGWVIAKISQKLKHKSFITVIVSLAFLGAYYFFYFRAQEMIQDLVQNVMIYGAKIKGAAYPLYLFGAAGTGEPLAMLLWTVFVAACFALVWYLISRSFIKLATATGSAKRVKYKETAVKVKNVRAALLEKEFARFTSSANYMLNCGLGTILLPALGIFLLVKGGDLIAPMYEMMGEYSGAIPVILCMGVCLVAAMNDMATPSISLEGKNLWLVQSLPVTPWQVLRAKLSVQILLTAIPAAFCAVCAVAIVPCSIGTKLLSVLVVLLNTVLSACFGLSLGVKMPNLTWTNETAPIKQSGNIMIALFGGWAYEMILIGLYFAVRKFMSTSVYLLACAVITAALAAALYSWLKRKGTRLFAAL